jgi:hypothetical protein
VSFFFETRMQGGVLGNRSGFKEKSGKNFDNNVKKIVYVLN